MTQRLRLRMGVLKSLNESLEVADSLQQYEDVRFLRHLIEMAILEAARMPLAEAASEEKAAGR